MRKQYYSLDNIQQTVADSTMLNKAHINENFLRGIEHICRYIVTICYSDNLLMNQLKGRREEHEKREIQKHDFLCRIVNLGLRI